MRELEALAARDRLHWEGQEETAGAMPYQLSGGQMQRVAIARALVHSPDLVLADEPTGNLDSATGEVVLELLLALNREQGATMVLVTHEQSIARCADRSIVLRDGLIASNEGVRP